jgi:hypothetical protein
MRRRYYNFMAALESRIEEALFKQGVHTHWADTHSILPFMRI